LQVGSTRRTRRTRLYEILVLLALGASGLTAQETGTIRGVVLEEGSSRPLVSAEVQVFQADGTAFFPPIGTFTDSQGAFVLQNVPPGIVEVRATYLAHSTRALTLEVTPDATADASFELPPTVFDLDEIVVTGAGGEFQKKQLGNSIAVVDAGTLADAPLTNLSELIQAREPAVVGLTSERCSWVQAGRHQLGVRRAGGGPEGSGCGHAVRERSLVRRHSDLHEDR
jgi:hypothetical protein